MRMKTSRASFGDLALCATDHHCHGIGSLLWSELEETSEGSQCAKTLSRCWQRGRAVCRDRVLSETRFYKRRRISRLLQERTEQANIRSPTQLKGGSQCEGPLKECSKGLESSKTQNVLSLILRRSLACDCGASFMSNHHKQTKRVAFYLGGQSGGVETFVANLTGNLPPFGWIPTVLVNMAACSHWCKYYNEKGSKSSSYLFARLRSGWQRLHP